MANNDSALEQLKSFLNELFQFDSAELKNYTYDLLYINEQAHIEGYQPIEEVFKNKILA